MRTDLGAMVGIYLGTYLSLWATGGRNLEAPLEALYVVDRPGETGDGWICRRKASVSRLNF